MRVHVFVYIFAYTYIYRYTNLPMYLFALHSAIISSMPVFIRCIYIILTSVSERIGNFPLTPLSILMRMPILCLYIHAYTCKQIFILDTFLCLYAFVYACMYRLYTLWIYLYIYTGSQKASAYGGVAYLCIHVNMCIYV